MKTLSSLTIFFPSLNDALSLPSLIQKADATARKLTSVYEIVVINDGSTDGTVRVVEQLRSTYPKLRIITHRKNRGYGAALISGFRTARFEWVFYTDGDGQYDPTELTRLASLVNPNVDVVNGYKQKRADPRFRTIIGSIYNWYVHLIHPLPLRDIDCDFRLIRHSIMKNVKLTNQSGTICLELITKLHNLGARFTEAAITHHPRKYGRSQFFTLRHIFTTFREICSLDSRR